MSHRGRRQSGAPLSGPKEKARPRRRSRWVRWLAITIIVTGAITVLMIVRSHSAQSTRWERDIPKPSTAQMEPRVARLLSESREAVLRNPDSAEAWGRFGAVCDAHKLRDDAAPCYRRARALAPNDFRWPYLLAIVREFQGAGSDEAASLLREAARLAPDFPPAFFRIGQLLARRGKLVEAREAYEKTIQLDPSLAIAHRSLGQLLVALDDSEAAIRHLERATELAQEDRAVFAAFAQAYARMGDPQRAAEAAEKSQRLPSVLALPDSLAYEIEALAISSIQCDQRARRLMRQGDYAAALENLKIVEEARPDDPEVQYRLGILYTRTGESQLAIEHLVKAVRHQDDLVDAHVQLASLLMTRGRSDEAISHYRRALGHDPTNGVAHLQLGTALARRGDLDEAIATFEQAATLAPPGAQLHMNWGTALKQRGNAAEAVDHYRQAL
ncbi:MAG: tetratricopeptide repeat protein, partial [Thermoanaerobaculia bacterium]